MVRLLLLLGGITRTRSPQRYNEYRGILQLLVQRIQERETFLGERARAVGLEEDNKVCDDLC